MKKERYIGIMSGTSLDGVDVVLCEIDATSCNLISTLEYPMPQELKTDILTMIATKSSLAEVGQLDQRLGILFTQAVGALLIRENIDASTVRAIGSHGQTLWHEPEGDDGFTMQLGDPNILAARTGISVVADFRRKDVALGGQGAPFAPAFHEFIFTNIKSSVSIVNIGGMANITILKNPMNDKLIGYDTGCGNVLLDMWISKHQGLSYDKNGAWAKSGSVDDVLLKLMLSDAYFSQPYPKSTGREKFNKEWLEQMISRRGEPVCSPTLDDKDNTTSRHTIKGNHKGLPLRSEDVQRTLLELTALGIVSEVKKFNIEVLMLCGGGAKNTFLVERIREELPHMKVDIAQHADEIEAMTFAWLAYKHIHKEKVNLKDVTGARENTILGGNYA